MQRLVILIVPICLVAGCTVPSTDTSAPKFSDVPPPAPPARRGVLADELLPSVRTNLLAFHLVAEHLPLYTNGHSLRPTADQLSEIRLQPEPIISDGDLVAWDVPNYTFVITPTAVKRLISQESKLGEFVLMSSGHPIYIGTFLSLSSSSSYGVPVILTETLSLIGKTNRPLDLGAYPQVDPRLVERLMALRNPANNVTLEIDPGYPNSDFKPKPDVRDDPRIAAAVEKLFGKAKP